MGRSWNSWKEYQSPKHNNQTQTELLGLNPQIHFTELNTDQEQALVEGFQKNHTFEETETQYGEEREEYSYDPKGDCDNETINQYPLRPYAEDCTFYLKSGMCKFGSHCRFNHHVRRENLGARQKEKGGIPKQNGQIQCKYYLRTGGCKYGDDACRYKHSGEKYEIAQPEFNSFGLPVEVGLMEKEKEGFMEQTGHIECKMACPHAKKSYEIISKQNQHEVLKEGEAEMFYWTTGGCKYGSACKYSHSGKSSKYVEKSELAQLELNFLGLPIRVHEKECPYYMHTGSCAFGVGCRFHHPEPTIVEGSDPFNSAPAGLYVGGHSSGNQSGESDSLQSWSSVMTVDRAVPCLNSSDSPGICLDSELYGYKNSLFAQERSRNPHLAPVNNLVKTSAACSVHKQQQEEYPERPAESECAFFMETGDFKYRSSCKFNHPKSRASKSPLCTLSQTGLPLRPGQKICRHYKIYGICKFGSGCFFDHPESHASPAFQHGSASESSSGTNTATFGVPEIAGCGGGSETTISSLYKGSASGTICPKSPSVKENLCSPG